jgi:O-antigen biosynthesis protein WbqV
MPIKRLVHPWGLALDVVLAGVTYVGAYLIRLDPVFYEAYWPIIFRTTPIVMALAGISFAATGLYRSLPKYASLDTLISIARSCTVAVALSALVIFLLWRGTSFPRSVPIIHWMLMFLALSGVRMLPRFRHYRLLGPLRAARADLIPVIVYGALAETAPIGLSASSMTIQASRGARCTGDRCWARGTICSALSVRLPCKRSLWRFLRQVAWSFVAL